MPAIAETKRSGHELAELLRRYDRDRYLLALFAPAERRDAVMALYAFNYEIAKIRETVSQPVLGQIRLQWWREGLDAAAGDVAVRRHEVLTPLAAAIRRHGLSRAHFDRLIGARERDLSDESPATLAALEAYAEETAAPLQFLTLEALGVTAPEAMKAARPAAIAFALTGLSRATPHLARTRRHILPQALIDETEFDPETLFAGKPSPKLAEIVRRIAVRAEFHLYTARALQPQLAPAALPALLPAVLAAADLKRLRRANYNVFAASVQRSDPWRSWRLTLAALIGRY
jgi:NADH dehydrogenase [ubiquinone] 1 alpha subcomplex assembly factor 6